MRIALRVEARSRRGLREGVRNLLRLFGRYEVRATFFLPVWPDQAGLNPLRAWRDRSALGGGAPLRGWLLPGHVLCADSADLAAQAREQGHEVGLIGPGPAHRAGGLASAGDREVHGWYRHLMALCPPALCDPSPPFAATDWQVHPALLSDLAVGACPFTSMTRGRMPYLPQLQGRRSGIVEVPTTLPTVDEALIHDHVVPGKVHEFLYAESQHVLPAGHVFAARAEREGIDRLDLMEKLLVMWRSYDGAIRPLGEMLREIDRTTLMHHQVGWARWPGRVEYQATQSVAVPA